MWHAPTPSVPRARKTWPRAVGAVALVVIAACGALVLTTPAKRGSLVSRSNWSLSTALPPRSDFPADWDYSVSGLVGWAFPPSRSPQGAAATAGHAARYTPEACGDVPTILTGPGRYVAHVRADHDPDPWWIAKAVPPDAAATGETDEHGPTASFVIWAVDDGPALITDYLRWLRRCRSYQVAAEDPFTHETHERAVSTVIDKTSDGHADAAVAVTRWFVTTGDGHAPSSTYRVSYYAVRGLLLECSTNVDGSGAEMVGKLAGQTVQRIGAL
ncbi:MAG TPA: hypothetical protein VFR17_07410 [Mycobacterium sp.]|nr:hypothetical protein [Mycobacterium sp.]